MTKQHTKETEVLLAAYRHTKFLKGVEHTQTRPVPDSTGFHDEAIRREVPGERDASVRFDGMFEYDTDDDAETAGEASTDRELKEAIEDTVPRPVTVAYAGMQTVGNPCYLGDVRTGEYRPTAQTSEVVMWRASLECDGGIDRGVALHDETSRGAAFDGASHDNGASSADGGVGHLHVIANTRDDASAVIVQDSADDSTFADLIEFASIAAATETFERKTVTGTVNRYTRARLGLGLGSGSITPVVAFART